MSDPRLKVWFTLFVLAVFCVGLAAGVLIGQRMPAGGPAPPRGGPPFALGPGPPLEGPSPPMMIRRLAEALDLTADQQTQVEAIMKKRRGRATEMQREVSARFGAEQQALRDEIRALLTPDQQARFERWLEEGPRGPFGGRNGRPPFPQR